MAKFVFYFIEELKGIPKTEKHAVGLKKDFGQFYEILYKQLNAETYHGKMGVSSSRLNEFIETKQIDGVILKRNVNNQTLVRSASVELYIAERKQNVSLAENAFFDSGSKQ
ncbi:hypothetical protein GK047_21700 [Paenibacillus sp. SYP-B3998]|uniref:Uncharacterized protein n=1 Tax=Paenibacillus sp. SYP-B3998 TaxID=2678564 RepID=A0A6G4A3U9_9BACL|nr:hypothetical protein [Paenibacillus sp. SYP-B3998]NEW08614.1 hypothetical protein [Paenibacillus sp. SYP-B3998]